MKVLAVRQPWASLIVNGIKNVENRSWDTRYRGKLFIHAAKTKPHPDDIAAAKSLCEKAGMQFPDELPTGGIIGSVDFVGVVWVDGLDIRTDTKYKYKDLRGYNDYDYGFILENPATMDLVPLKGMLGLFNPPDEIRDLLEKIAV